MWQVPVHSPTLDARSSGFSLIEVMVATVVLAIGMLGLSLLIAQSLRFSHVSTIHSHATLLAQSMMDRMASNVQGVWLGAYDGTFTGAPGFSTACTVSTCAPSELAARDTNQWRTEIGQLLPPGSSGSITCVASELISAEVLLHTPTYDGSCMLSMAWQEHDSEGEVANQAVSWRFRP